MFGFTRWIIVAGLMIVEAEEKDRRRPQSLSENAHTNKIHHDGDDSPIANYVSPNQQRKLQVLIISQVK